MGERAQRHDSIEASGVHRLRGGYAHATCGASEVLRKLQEGVPARGGAAGSKFVQPGPRDLPLREPSCLRATERDVGVRACSLFSACVCGPPDRTELLWLCQIHLQSGSAMSPEVARSSCLIVLFSNWAAAIDGERFVTGPLTRCP